MTAVKTITEKINDCDMTIESLEVLIKKHGMKPLTYAQTHIKEQRLKAIKELSNINIEEIEVIHEEIN